MGVGGALLPVTAHYNFKLRVSIKNWSNLPRYTNFRTDSQFLNFFSFLLNIDVLTSFQSFKLWFFANILVCIVFIDCGSGGKYVLDYFLTANYFFEVAIGPPP